MEGKKERKKERKIRERRKDKLNQGYLRKGQKSAKINRTCF